MQKVLDLSIRDYYKDEKNSGFQINQKVYNNYMSNHKWDLFVKQMQIDCPLGYNQYKKGSGKELEPKRYPPKMASYGASPR